MTVSTQVHPPPPRLQRLRLLPALGWALIAAGAVILLYVVYSLFFTGLTTARAQDDLSSAWAAEVGRLDPVDPTAARPSVPLPSAPVEAAGADPADDVVEVGQAVAALEFVRPGSSVAPVHAGPLFVVEGVTRNALTRGPGHYPGTALPGQAGNFAVAGHRTTYAAPFFHLDQLVVGDEVWVTDRSGTRHVYRVAEQRIVGPADTSVLRSDPRDTGIPALTLTTCHPRFSAAQRLVVFAELVT